jgi:hypothetical protein
MLARIWWLFVSPMDPYYFVVQICSSLFLIPLVLLLFSILIPPYHQFRSVFLSYRSILLPLSSCAASDENLSFVLLVFQILSRLL